MNDHPETPKTQEAPVRSSRRINRAAVALFIGSVVLAASTLNSNPTRAWSQVKTEGGGEVFVKINKLYINLNTISHVIDEPGYNSPPGSMQIFLSGAPQNFINLYGEQAEAFRQVINSASVDHTPKDQIAAPKAAPAAKKLSIPPKKAPSTDPG